LDSPSDYPPGRGRVRVEAAGIDIEGVSVAGHESFYKLPGLRILLDFGRSPEDTVSYATIFLSHAHLDHAAGLAHHASRRRLAGLPAARVFLPEQAIEDVRSWLAASERLEAVSYGVELLPARPGESIQLRRDLEVRFLPGRHRVPSVGYLINEVRHKLRDEHAGRPGSEIASLRARGVEVTRREETPLLAYPGDCGAEIFEAAPEIFSARVLLIECSFLLPEDVERARRYSHLHMQDFLERADLFRNEAIVLTHFSQRYLPHEIRRALEELPPHLADRVIPFLPPEAG
jgi:ribonuclease Z